jgi:hypothetical protein
MTFVNEGGLDRTIRMLGGTALLAVGWSGLAAGTLGMVMMGVGGIALLTGLAGWCPAYSLFRLSTVRSGAKSWAQSEPPRQSR